MNKRQKSQLIFEEPRYLASAPPALTVFLQPEGIVKVELNPGADRDYGLIAGSEGLGCEFFLDADNNLFATDMSLPFDVVDVAPMQLLEPLRKRIKDGARPGVLSLKNCPKVSINPDAVWFFAPFGSAIFSFDWVVLEPLQKFWEEEATTDFIEIGQGVTAGIGRETRSLRLLLVEGFDKNQRVFDLEVSAESHSEQFMQALNSIHLKYFEDVEPNEFRNFAAGVTSRLQVPQRDEAGAPKGMMQALDRLVAMYQQNLELESETVETEIERPDTAGK